MNSSTRTDERPPATDPPDPLPGDDPAAELDRITSFVQATVDAAGANGVVINLSGGLDSTVTAALAVEALGPDRVYGLILPCNKLGSIHARDAEGIAEALGITHDTVHLQPLFSQFGRAAPARFDLHDEPTLTGNAIARLRMTLAYLAANATGRLVCGTTNRSERLLGYVTKHGDGAADLLPLGHCYKTEVRRLAEALDVPEFVVDKPPSAGFLPGQRDVDDLGAPYEVIDRVFRIAFDEPPERSLDAEAIAARMDGDVDPAVIERLLDRYRSTAHKRSPPPMPTSRRMTSNGT